HGVAYMARSHGNRTCRVHRDAMPAAPRGDRYRRLLERGHHHVAGRAMRWRGNNGLFTAAMHLRMSAIMEHAARCQEQHEQGPHQDTRGPANAWRKHGAILLRPDPARRVHSPASDIQTPTCPATSFLPPFSPVSFSASAHNGNLSVPA